jgi:PAS domain S-box-containing protein
MRNRSIPFGNEEHLRMLFRQLPGAVWTTDRDLRLTYVAGRLAGNIGLKATPGMSVYDVVGTHEPTNRFIAYHRAALLGDSQSFETEFKNRWYEVLIEQLKDESGAATGCIAAAFDITDQRKTQERLNRSEVLLEQAQRVAHIGSFEWDLASNVVHWSDELHRIYGLEPDQFRGTYEAFLERVHPDDMERTKNAIFTALRKGSPVVYEHRIIRSDGSERVLHTQGDVVKAKDGHATGIAGCCWDITEQRATMESLGRARSVLEATLEATADGLLVVDRKGGIAAYNRRFLSLWHIPRDLPKEHNDEKLLAYVSDQLENPEHFLYTTQDLYRHPDRESFDTQRFKDGRVFERYSRPQRIHGEIVGRVWSFRDITERETLLRRAVFLSDATRLLSSLNIEPALDSVAHLAVPFMGDGCAIDLLGNGHPRRLLFVSREGAELGSPELQPAITSGHSAIYSTGTRSCMAVPLVVKDAVAGAITFIGPSMHRYRKTDLEFAETLGQRAALALENALVYRKAQEALQTRDEFLTIAAHEIRGPITSIHLATQALLTGKASEPNTPKLLDIIEREDRRLAQFVNELLDLGRIRTSQIQFNLEEVDFGEVVRDAANTLTAELSRSGSTLSITTEGQLVGHWDRNGLSQVATNLLSNAIKFGEGKLIAISVREHQGQTILRVEDHGIGIHPEMLERMFRPFERGVSIRHHGGLGLGLFIARSIVEGLGGTIQVDSTPKIGSTFTVELRNA